MLPRRLPTRPRGPRRWVRRLWAWVLLPSALIAGTVALVVRAATDPERVRRTVQEQIAARLNAVVVIGEARLDLGGDLQLYDVEIRSLRRREGDPVMVSAARVRLDLDLWNALSGGGPAIRAAEFDHPCVNIVLNDDGPDNYTDAVRTDAPDPGPSAGAFPTLRFTEARFRRWERRSGRLVADGEIPPLDAEFSPAGDDGSVAFRIAAAGLPGKPGVAGTFSPATFRLSVAAHGPLELGPGTAAYLPEEFRAIWERLGVRLRFAELSGSWDGPGTAPTARVVLADGGAELPTWRLLPGADPAGPPPMRYEGQGAPEYADVTGLAATVDYGPEGLRVSDGRLRLNQTEFRFAGRVADPARADTALDFEVTSPALDLEQTAWAYRDIHEDIDDVLKKVALKGVLEAKVRLSRAAPGPDGRPARLLYDGVALMRDGFVMCRAFKYPVDDLAGEVRFSNGRVVLALDGARRGGTVRIDATLRTGDTKYAGMDLRILTRDTPLDDELANAIPEESRTYYTDWNLQGRGDSEVYITRPANDVTDGLDVHVIATVRGDASFQFVDLPLRVTDCHGVIEVRGGDLRGERGTGGSVHRLVGRSGGGRVELEGQGGCSPTGKAKLWAEFRTEGVALDEAFGEALPERFRDAYRKFSPSGRADLHARIVREPMVEAAAVSRLGIAAGGAPAALAAAGLARYEVSAEARDVAVTFDAFPYPVEGLRGRMRITPELVDIFGLAGRRGPARIGVVGTVPLNGRPMDVRLRADRLPLDATLAAALSPDLRSCWDKVNPSGSADVAAHLTGTPDDLRTELDVTATGVAVRPPDPAYPVTDIHGRLRMNSEGADLLGLTGRHGGGALSVCGIVRRDGCVLDLDVSAEALPLDADLRGILPEAARTVWDRLRPEGAVDVTGRLAAGHDPADPSISLDAGLRHDLHVVPHGLTLKPTMRYPFPVTGLRGTMRVTPGRVEVVGLAGRDGEVRITADGAVRTSDGHLSLALDFADLPTAKLSEMLEGPQRRKWEALRAEGKLDLSVRLDGRPPGPEGIRHTAKVGFAGLSLKPDVFPYALTDARGTVTLGGGDGWEFTNVAARHGGAELTVSGSRRPAADGRRGHMEISLAARDVELDDDLRAAVPAKLREGLAGLDPRGKADLKVNLLFAHDGDRLADTQFDGEITLKGGSINVGRPLEKVEAVVRGRGEMYHDTGKWMLEGEFAGKRALFRGLDLSALAGKIAKPVDTDTVAISDLAGAVCGGRFNGSAQASLGAKGRYSLKLNADRIALFDFWKGFYGKSANVAGVFDATLAARGALRGKDDFEMAGEVVCRDGRLGESVGTEMTAEAGRPFVAKTLDDGNSFAFESLNLRYRRRGDAWQFEDILVVGNGVRLAGRGSVSPKDELEMVFVVAPPKDGVRIPLFSELVTHFANELLQVRVGGTTAAPKIEKRPLDGIGSPLRELLKPPPAKPVSAPPADK